MDYLYQSVLEHVENNYLTQKLIDMASGVKLSEEEKLQAESKAATLKPGDILAVKTPTVTY